MTTLTLTPNAAGRNLAERPDCSGEGANRMRILLVEEEVQAAQSLRKGLVENGFAVDVMGMDSAGTRSPRRPEYDLLVCDVPAGVGRFSDLPWHGHHTPVLFL